MSKLPNHISIQVSSEEDLIALLEKVTEEDSKSREERIEYARKFLVAGDGSFSSERMIDALPDVEPIIQQENSIHFATLRIASTLPSETWPEN